MTRLVFSLLGAAALGLLLQGLTAQDLPLAHAVFAPTHPLAVGVERYAPLLSLAAYGLSLLWLARPAGRRHALGAPLALSLLLMAAAVPYGLVTIAKLLWGRPRFRDLGSDADFRAFSQLTPGGPGRSFCSGHVASALVFWPLALVLWRAERRRLAVGVGALILAWGALVAYGRMVAGAHFLTDVVGAFGLTLLAAPWVVLAASALLRRLPARA